ncbi:ANTAR domain-containing response regulator [Methyloterricola oryzae]|uniref:ANTAR domain-containing response regulator n=1 Tax=Methyloterricola oryzae TaxID=1495050 RepID=UPI00191028A3|nr:response regulator [Methyloterricola oryzae]
MSNAMPSILVVDDDKLVVATLARGLRSEGYEVLEASSGSAALRLAAVNSFDLAILDIRMPEMSGTELAQRLMSEHGLPALFLSAYSDREMVESAIARGGLGYLVKPVDVPNLIPALQTALARGRDINALLEAKSQLEQALSAGRETSTAMGILMERFRMSRTGAFEELRRCARSQGRKIDKVAQELVEAAETLNALGQAGPG